MDVARAVLVAERVPAWLRAFVRILAQSAGNVHVLHVLAWMGLRMCMRQGMHAQVDEVRGPALALHMCQVNTAVCVQASIGKACALHGQCASIA